jgi:predicted Zn-dependent protease
MPGGKIMVLSGLIDKLHATDDELAAVIGHEISHALREHGRERMSQAYIQQFGLQALAAALGGSAAGSLATQGAGLGTQLFFSLPNGREQEREADRMGLELAARAGYNPDAAITLWQKMSAQAKTSQPEFLSTHPASENRIKDLQALAPKVRPLYEAARKKY